MVRLEALLTDTEERPAWNVDARLRQMMDLHHDFLWRLLRRLGVPEAAVDDATQRVWIVVARRLGDIVAGGERAYLCGVAMRVAANERRSRTRSREVPWNDQERVGHDPLPDEQFAARRARELVDTILDTLPLDLRAPFVLFEVEELTQAEIASMLAIPVGTVASRLRRAREIFQQEIARRRARGALP